MFKPVPPAFKPSQPGPGSTESNFLNMLDPNILGEGPAGTAPEEIWEYNEARIDILRQHVNAIMEDILIQMPLSEQNAQLRSLRAVNLSLEIVALELRQLRAEGGASPEPDAPAPTE